MSGDSELMRIATALERIASALENTSAQDSKTTVPVAVSIDIAALSRQLISHHLGKAIRPATLIGGSLVSKKPDDAN